MYCEIRQGLSQGVESYVFYVWNYTWSEKMEDKEGQSMAERSLVCIVGGPKPARIEGVELRHLALPKVKLSSRRGIEVGATVLIQSGRNKALGIVTGCKTNLTRHDIVVEVMHGAKWLTNWFPVASGYDPGVHLVNKFISDEKLLQLTDELTVKTGNAL
jgi:hypothetical protein